MTIRSSISSSTLWLKSQEVSLLVSSECVIEADPRADLMKFIDLLGLLFSLLRKSRLKGTCEEAGRDVGISCGAQKSHHV